MREWGIVPRRPTELPENAVRTTDVTEGVTGGGKPLATRPPVPHPRAMEPVILTTERLILRPPAPGDARAVLAACQDPDIRRWTAVPSPYLPEHARTFVGVYVPEAWAADTEYVFGAFLAEEAATGGPEDTEAAEGPEGPGLREGPEGPGLREGPFVAMLGLKVRGQDTVEIGFWSVKEHRGRGHVTEATRALCRWAFTDLGAARVEWRAGVGNTASRAVAERCGFVQEGVLRQAIVSGGTRHDAWIASLLPQDTRH